jgi:hypothetical protein
MPLYERILERRGDGFGRESREAKELTELAVAVAESLGPAATASLRPGPDGREVTPARSPGTARPG